MNFDVTFCKAWIRCKKGDHCHLALTENVFEYDYEIFLSGYLNQSLELIKI